MVNYNLKIPYFDSSYCFLAAKLWAFIISYFIFVGLLFLHILGVVLLSTAVWTAGVRFIWNCFMTATASDIAASFLERYEDDKFHIIFFVVWCKKWTELQKSLICVDLETEGAVFSGQQEFCVWAVHCAVTPYFWSSSGEKTMTMYGGCTLIADACFA